MTDLKWERRGAAAEAVLTRPAARNALTTEMVEVFARGLEAANADPDVACVIVRSDLEGCFCAGGDMRRIRTLALAGEFAEAEAFFRTEYALNLSISRSEKPVVALVDGLCMGGGLGLSVHGICVATRRSVFAMPEGLIGWFPDVGASYFLSRTPHRIGLYLGLSSRRMSASDACAAGLAAAVVAPERAPALLDRLRSGERAQDVVRDGAERASDWSEDLDVARIAQAFGRSSLGEIFRALEDAGPWGEKLLEEMRAASPRSLELTFELISAGTARTLGQCLEAEAEAAAAQLRHPDFAEGVRAVLVDKDRSPRWSPQNE